MNKMYDISQLYRALRDPKRAFWELSWQYHRRLRGRSGLHVMEQDWDNLLILDACRYDLFEQLSDIKGDLSRVISRGSSTPEFIDRTFSMFDESYGDTVYLSANPQLDNNGVDGQFHSYVPAWEELWDDSLNTVPPGALTDSALEIADEYPEKRLIVHFIQPHFPFIGEHGRELEHRSFHGGGVLADPDTAENSIWDRLRDGEVSKESVRAAYQENLELVLPHVKTLIDSLDGKSVVTSDHGNSFGRFGVWGHPSRYYLRDLVAVPWLEAPATSRRMTTDGELATESVVDGDVEERLADLGYR